MSDAKYVRVERQEEALIVSPLFTFARFTEADIADEWQQVVDDGLGDQDLTVVTRALEQQGGTP